MTGADGTWQPHTGAPVPVATFAACNRLVVRYGKLEAREDYPWTEQQQQTATEKRLCELLGVPNIQLCRGDSERLWVEIWRMHGKIALCTQVGTGKTAGAVVARAQMPQPWRGKDGLLCWALSDRRTGPEADQAIADAEALKRAIDGLGVGL